MALSVLLCAVSIAAVLFAEGSVPPQFFYDASTATSMETLSGCSVTHWDGFDSDGMAGPPWVSYINCSSSSTYTKKGVATEGDFQIWLHYGKLTLNGEELTEMGESFWVAAGAFAALSLQGSAYVVGSKFELDSYAPPAVFVSSYQGPETRSYTLRDAINNRSNATLGHDGHITNGSSPSMDFIFGSQTQVDPPSVVVLNCAAGSTPDTNFVWSHFHPFGAVYMPFSGEICFATDSTTCVRPGTARWTSPNLQYYETFKKINSTNILANQVRDLAKVSEAECEYPNVFAVTNFDASITAGVPNFGDWPLNAHSNALALGIGPWGIFNRMTVRATKIVVKTAIVDMKGESQLLV